MANTLTPIVPKILGRAMMALRQTCWMPRLVNSDYSADASRKGSTIDVQIPSALTASDVAPSVALPTPSDSAPTVVQVQLNNWKHVAIGLNDSELKQIDANAGFMPMQLSEGMKALGNAVNISIWSKFTGVYGAAGTAGTTPFASSIDVAMDVRKILADQLCPKTDRRFVIDNAAEANALKLAPFRDASQSADKAVIIEGEIGRKLGFDWYADDHVPLHTAGTASGSTTNAAGYAVGVTTITLASAGTGSWVEGDIFTIAGQTQQYVIVTGDADVSGGGTITFQPPLAVAITTAATALTRVATHRVNLAFHRDAFAFATRSLASELDNESPTTMYTMQDPKTGLVLRVELLRQNKQWVWDFDILWGVALVRPQLACRLLG